MNLKRTIIGLGAALFIGRVVAGIGFVAWVALLSSIWTSADTPHKSDQELIANFKTNEAEFNQLLQMVMADKRLHRVDDNWTDPSDPKTIGIPDERIAVIQCSARWISRAASPPTRMLVSLNSFLLHRAWLW